VRQIPDRNYFFFLGHAESADTLIDMFGHFRWRPAGLASTGKTGRKFHDGNSLEVAGVCKIFLRLQYRRNLKELTVSAERGAIGEKL
jgi:hypothetical protein